MVVSDDRDAPIERQIELAARQAQRFPGQLHTFLLKPESAKSRLLHLKALHRQVRHLKAFAMLGVTEKELGETMPARIKAIAAIRGMMDKAGVKAPIHVFGGLDTLSVILYFLAGAEVFDGLTWLRFGFRDGLALYVENYFALASDAQVSRASLQAKLMVDNYYAMGRLQARMHRYLRTRSLADLAPHSELAEQILADLGERDAGD